MNSGKLLKLASHVVNSHVPDRKRDAGMSRDRFCRYPLRALTNPAAAPLTADPRACLRFMTFVWSSPCHWSLGDAVANASLSLTVSADTSISAICKLVRNANNCTSRGAQNALGPKVDCPCACQTRVGAPSMIRSDWNSRATFVAA